MSIVFTDDEDENAYCDSCDFLLIERKDSSRVCSNPQCGREYLPDSVQKHKRKLSPDKSRYDNNGPELVSMTGYGRPGKKPPTPGEIDDKHFVKKEWTFNNQR